MSSSLLHRFDSPLGPLQVLLDAQGALIYLGFAEHEARERLLLRLFPFAVHVDGVTVNDLQKQMAEYFDGRRCHFEFPVNLLGTPFQRRVWAELQCIPFGTTLSYLNLARRLGDPRLTRAVGTANGANPVSILVPCHRVIGHSGKLTGYAGGLTRKQGLLELEHHGRLPGAADTPLIS